MHTHTHTCTQIINAPHKSHKARLVSYGDKLYNLRDLNNSTPDDWSQERAHEYFQWSAKVIIIIIEGLRTMQIEWSQLLICTPRNAFQNILNVWCQALLLRAIYRKEVFYPFL